jgi:translation elongation factor EF-1beta
MDLKKLILIIVIICSSFLIFGFDNFELTATISDKEVELTKIDSVFESVTGQVYEILDSLSHSVERIDWELSDKMKSRSSQIVKVHFKDIVEQDLTEIKKSLGMDLIYDDINIISKNGVIVNSTFNKDIGINLYEISNDYKEKIENSFLNSEFHSEPLFWESSTRKLRKFSYQTTTDKSEIVELSVYPRKGDSVLQSLKDKIELISINDKEIDAVEVFFKTSDISSLNQYSTIDDEHTQLLLDVFDNNGFKTIVKEYGDNELIYYFRYLGDFYGIKCLIRITKIQIKSDLSIGQKIPAHNKK